MAYLSEKAVIPFYRPYFDHSELLAALRPRGGRREFEATLAARVGAKYGIAFAYGRSGILASLKALGISQAEVIMPAYTCLVMAQAVVASGNRPVFVDIDLADYNMSVSAVKQALTPHTRAIVATHLYGYPTDVDAIRATAGDGRIVVIEDCAQGLLTPFPGTTGVRGDIGLFSFGPNKQLSTIQGGVIVTNASDLYEKIKAYRDREAGRVSFKVWAKRWMRLVASYLVFNKPMYGLLQRAGLVGWGSHQSDSVAPSAAEMPDDYDSAYMDFQGRVGLAQLRKLDTVLARRRALAELYDREFHGVPGLSPAPIVAGATYSQYTLRIARRDEINITLRMLACGVSVDQTFDYALPYLKPYRPYARSEYPCAEQAAREVVNLPSYPNLSVANAQYIAASIRRSVQEGLKAPEFP
jgi:perosamine synthetase